MLTSFGRDAYAQVVSLKAFAVTTNEIQGNMSCKTTLRNTYRCLRAVHMALSDVEELESLEGQRQPEG